MATYKILYWQEVPTQIKAEDDDEEVTLPLGEKFMALIDRLAMERNLQNSDDYLAQWRWCDEADRPGSAREVAEALKQELESEAG
jgi:hypothetical protein